MQSQILEKHASPELTVYAVWFNMVPGDDRSRWPEGLLDDPRVVELWDEARILGRWFAEHPDFEDKGLSGGGVMWDTYLLFGPEARWEEAPAPLLSAGHTIVRARERLAKDLASLLERATKGAPSGRPR